MSLLLGVRESALLSKAFCSHWSRQRILDDVQASCRNVDAVGRVVLTLGDNAAFQSDCA
jgi:hypothetical protein